MVYLVNAFSINMLDFNERQIIDVAFSPISLLEAKNIILDSIKSKEFVSAIGHQSTAILLSKIIQIPIPENRIDVKLKPNDSVVVFQVLFRPEEGKVYTTEELEKFLEEGKIRFFYCKILFHNDME